VTAFRVGLVVNPIAGLGGAAGLKGSDGAATQAHARALDIEAPAPGRALRFLRALVDVAPSCALLTGTGGLGEDVARSVGWSPTIVYRAPGLESTAEDTKALARLLIEAGADVVAFVGGDGTARDVADAIGTSRAAVGVPSGVKMQSGVFGITPEAAAALVRRTLLGDVVIGAAEVVDIDEAALRDGRLSSQLYGVLCVPQQPGLLQSRKVGSGSSASDLLAGIAAECGDRLDPQGVVLLGPGSTVATVAERMGYQSSLLGVDIVDGGKVVVADANSHQIRQRVADRRTQVVVTPIGGQGVILGRGNQQIDSEVLRRLPMDDLLVVGAPSKLASLGGGRLYVDLSTPDLNTRWSGPRRVIVGHRQEAVLEVAAV
jgi:predicted polyphosphate/ATP-dependent NAD kinase